MFSEKISILVFNYIRYFAFITISLLIALSAQVRMSLAASDDAYKVIESGCDPAFMNSLNKKAEMEAMRDIAMAQTHIKKPDSVFQLTCFDKMGAQATYVAIFPDTEPASSRRTRLANVLNASLAGIVDGAWKGNFDHTALGGYISMKNYEFEPRSSMFDSAGYSCNQMQRVWDEAKCITFDESDFYYDTPDVIAGGGGPGAVGTPSIFPNIESDDPPPPASDAAWDNLGSETRNSPKPRICADMSGDIWEDMAKIAFNIVEGGNELSYDFRYFLDPGITVDDSAYPTYADNLAKEPWFILTQDKSTAGSCVGGVGILTGLVYQQGGNTYCDGFCPNPGCTYEPNTISGTDPASCTPGACN